jgi:hypothetical protein
MAPVLMTCPVTGGLVPTGVGAEPDQELLGTRVLLACPDCGDDHWWDPVDAEIALEAR